jgi:hypothetical protein
MKIFQPTISGSFTTSGSVFLKGLTSTAQSNVVTIDTATGQLYATASLAIAPPPTPPFPFTGTAEITGSLIVTNTIQLDQSLTDFAAIQSTIVGANNLFQQATGSYTSAHGKYTIYKGANARAGEFVTVWNGTDIVSYDNSTTDIGTTTDINFQSQIVTSQLQLNAAAASSGWTVKMIVTYL